MKISNLNGRLSDTKYQSIYKMLMSYLILICSFVLGPKVNANNPSCPLLFGNSKPSEIDNSDKRNDQLYKKLTELPSISLDIPTVEMGVENFWTSIRSQIDGFKKLDMVSNKFELHQISRDEALAQILILQNKSFRAAEKLLMSHSLSQEQRYQLEGHRLFLISAKNRLLQIEHMKVDPAQSSKNIQDRLNEYKRKKQTTIGKTAQQEGSSPNNDLESEGDPNLESESNNEDNKTHDQQKSNPESEDSKFSNKATNSNQQARSENHLKSKEESHSEQNHSNHKNSNSDSNSNSNSNSPPNKSLKSGSDGQEETDRQENLAELRKGLNQNQNQSQNRDSAMESDESKGVSVRSDGKNDEGGDQGETSKFKNSKNEDDEASAQQHLDLNSKASTIGNSDTNTNQQERSDQESVSTSKESSRSKKNHSNQNKKEQGRSRGKDIGSRKKVNGVITKTQNHSAGKESGQRNLTESLSSLFQRLFADQPKIIRTSLEDSKKRVSKRSKNRMNERPELLSPFNSMGSIWEMWKRRNTESQNKSGAEDFDKFGPLKRKSLEITSDAHLGKLILEQMWIDTLRNYRSSADLRGSIAKFRLLCKEYQQRRNNVDYPEQFSERATDFYNSISSLDVEYADLNQLSLDFLAFETAPSEIMVRLVYFDRIFSELENITTLTRDESNARDLIKSLIKKIQSKSENPSEKEIGKAFLRQLSGPLSKKSIKNMYQVDQQGEELNWAQLNSDINSNSLNNYLFMNAVKSYLNNYLTKRVVPRTVEINKGFRRPMDNEEFKIELADDITSWQNFYRNGPPSLDIQRLLSDDLLEMTYRDPVTQHGFSQTKDKKTSVIVFDISLSMQYNEKYLLQNSLILAYLDWTQIEVARGQSEHSVYAIPFGSSVGDPEKLTNLKQNYDYFQRIVKDPIMSDSGTNITNAIVHAYEMIKQHSESGGDLSKANILFLTDGEDRFDINEVKKIRDQISKKIDTSFSVIAIGDGNEQFAEALTNGIGKSVFGKYEYKLINREEIARLRNKSAAIELINENAKFMDLSSMTEFGSKDLLSLKQAFMKIQSDDIFEISETNRQILKESLRMAPKFEETNEMDSIFDMLVSTEPSQTAINSIQTQARFKLLENFLTFLGREIKSDRQEVINGISQSTYRKLMNWLEEKDLISPQL